MFVPESGNGPELVEWKTGLRKTGGIGWIMCTLCGNPALVHRAEAILRDRPVFRIRKASERYEKMRELTGNVQADFQKEIMKAQEQLAKSVTLRDLREAVDTGETRDVLRKIDWDGYQAGMVAAANTYATKLIRDVVEWENSNLELGVGFDVVNPHVEAWMRNHTANKVVQISEQTRQAIRTQIIKAHRAGEGAYRAGRRIRSMIGLTERQANAVWNKYWDYIERDYTKDRAEELAKRYADKHLRYRAERIARTELNTAANEGQHLLHDQAFAEGKLSKRRWGKEWLTAGDDRVCSICLSVEGSVVPYDQNFDIGVWGPIAHVLCRCTYGLVKLR